MINCFSLQRLRSLITLAILALFLVPASPNAMETRLSDELEQILREPFTGDFDAIAERGYLRVLVPFSKTFYFIDNGVQRGTAVDMTTELGKFLEKKHN